MEYKFKVNVGFSSLEELDVVEYLLDKSFSDIKDIANEFDSTSVNLESGGINSMGDVLKKTFGGHCVISLCIKIEEPFKLIKRLNEVEGVLNATFVAV